MPTAKVLKAVEFEVPSPDKTDLSSEDGCEGGIPNPQGLMLLLSCQPAAKLAMNRKFLNTRQPGESNTFIPSNFRKKTDGENYEGNKICPSPLLRKVSRLKQSHTLRSIQRNQPSRPNHTQVEEGQEQGIDSFRTYNNDCTSRAVKTKTFNTNVQFLDDSLSVNVRGVFIPDQITCFYSEMSTLPKARLESNSKNIFASPALNNSPLASISCTPLLYIINPLQTM